MDFHDFCDEITAFGFQQKAKELNENKAQGVVDFNKITAIKMKAPHFAAKQILWKYGGTGFTKDLGGGCFITIKRGDYTSGSACMSQEWLLSNLELWEVA